MAEDNKQLSQQETETDTVEGYETYPEEEQYTTEEDMDAIQAEEAAELEAAEDYQNESTIEMSEDATDTDEEETKTYNNNIAKILGNIGSALKKFGLTSGIGSVFESLAKMIDNVFSGNTDEESADITDTQYIRDSLEGIDQEELVDSLNSDASQISSYGSISTEEGTPAEELNQAIKESAQESPKDTAKAIQVFNDTAEDAIAGVYSENEEAYSQAMENLGAVNQTLTESLYGTLMEGEQSGTHMLSEETVEYVDSLHVTGVNMAYSEYTPEADVSVQPNIDSGVKEAHEDLVNEGFAKSQCLQNESDADNLQSSNGLSSWMQETSEKENADVVANTFDTLTMHDMGTEDIDALTTETDDASNTVSASDSMASMSSGVLTEEGLYDIHSTHDTATSLNDIYHDSYAGIINGLTAYNDAAVNEIENKYGADAEGKQEATDKLADTMRTNVEKVFSSLKSDDEALGFLTDEDKTQLDNLKITGVNVKFSNYQEGMNLKTGQIQEDNMENVGEMSEEEQQIYENASPADWTSESPLIDDTSMFTNEDAGQKTARQKHGQDEGTKTLEDSLARAQAEQQAEEALQNTY